MSKPRLPKRIGRAPALREPILTEGDLATIKAARALREKLQEFYKTPCEHCGAMPTIPRLAAQIGVDSAVLWRFINAKQDTLMEDNFKKLQEWAEKRRK